MGGTTTAINQGSGWGSSIWSTTGLTAGFDAGSRSKISTSASTVTGSGLLADTSVPDAQAPVGRPPNSLASHIPSGSVSQTRFSNGLSTAAVAHSSGPHQSAPVPARNHQSYGNRPPPVNLNATASGLSRQNLDPTTMNSNFFGASDPPNVYTKFDRPSFASSSRPAAAEIGFWNDADTSHSPLDENSRPTTSTISHQSMPTSRNNSLPPSRHNDEPVAVSSVNNLMNDNFHRTSAAQLSRPNASTWTNPLSEHDAFASQFSQMILDSDRRGSSARRPSTAVNGTSGATYGHRTDQSASVNYRQNNAQSDAAASYDLRGSHTSRPVSQYSAQGFYGTSNGQHDGSFAYPENGFDPRLAAFHQAPREARRDSATSRDLQLAQHNFAMHSNIPLALSDDRVREYYFQQAMRDPQFAQMMVAQAQYNYYAYAPALPEVHKHSNCTGLVPPSFGQIAGHALPAGSSILGLYRQIMPVEC